MIRTSMPKRAKLFSRSALGIALALGTVAGAGLTAAPALAAAKAPKMSFSKGFVAVAGPLQKDIEDAKKRDDVVAAQKAVQAAQQQNNAAALQSATSSLSTALSKEKTELDTAFNAIENDDDRFMAGNLAVALGGVAMEPSLQRRGLEAMLQSGKVSEADAPRFHFFVGQIAYQQKDYPTALTNLKAAVDAGYKENDAQALLAEAYMANNQTAQGLAVLKQAIDQHEASGSPAPASWYRRGLAAAYNAKLLDKAADFGAALVKAYPSKENWAGAISILRELGNYSGQETLDLMRLMGRTNSFSEERDYVEYIQAADPRRLPGEALKVVDAGIAAGKLKPSDAFVSDAKTQASSRIAQDKASLASYERDARAPGAKEATVTGAADALLSYGESAKAEELYKIALPNAGAEAPRVLTRIGIAQTDEGKYAEAQQTFAKVTGPRQPIAEMWAAYAANKAAGSAPAAPATPAAQ